jgi:hypothetical protein
MDVALRCAAWFIEHPDVSDRYALSQIALIRQHASEYRVQFIGTFRNGNTVLLCNFFPARLSGQKDDPFPYWRNRKSKRTAAGFGSGDSSLTTRSAVARISRSMAADDKQI